MIFKLYFKGIYLWMPKGFYWPFTK